MWESLEPQSLPRPPPQKEALEALALESVPLKSLALESLQEPLPLEPRPAWWEPQQSPPLPRQQLRSELRSR